MNQKKRIVKKRIERVDFFELAKRALLDLPERVQLIFKQRFGLLDDFLAKTLDEIGDYHHVTRERIRQIITFHQKQITKKCEEAEFKKIEQELVFVIENNYGIVKEDCASLILDIENLPNQKNALRFFVKSSRRIKFVFERDFLEKSWVLSVEILDLIKKVILEAENILKKNNHTLTDEELAKELFLFFPNFSKKMLLSFLRPAVRIKKNQFKKWGLFDWPEINPKGSREKIYFILKEKGIPLHFTEIANLIDKYIPKLKKTHPQTIHNELIKDKKFILIGRGIYALEEWGYHRGTVEDVLREILEKNGRAMTQAELITEVLKIRQVKKTTIIINLNRKKVFKRNNDLYILY